MPVDIRELSRAYYQDISRTLIAERKVHKLPDFTPDEVQQRVIDSKSKYLRVVAPAGAGKTRTLTAKAVEILSREKSARVLCLTFTNAAADEFKRKASKVSSSLTERLHVSTVNSFGLEILRSFNDKLRIATPSAHIGTVFATIKAMMQESPIWEYESRHSLYQSIFELADVTKALGFSHRFDDESAMDSYEFVQTLGLNGILESKMDECEIVGDDGEKSFLEDWLPFWQEFTESLWSRNVISLEDQKYWALDQLTSNPKALLWLKKRKFTHVFVDEFQDINILDLFLIAMVVESTGASLVIVGDDDQCLYEWRGCTSTFIQFPDQVFAQILKGKTFEKIELEHNYRCPKNIVIHSAKLISNNNERISKQTNPIRKENANIRVIPLAAAYMTMNVVDELVADLATKHPKHSVAIVGRKKSQLIPIQILMTKRELSFRVDDDLNVFAGKAFKDFRELLELPTLHSKRRPASQNIADLIALLDRAVKSRISDSDRTGVYDWLVANEPLSLKEAVLHFGTYPKEFRKGYVQPSEIAEKLRYFLESDTVVKCLLIAGLVFKGFQKDFVKSKEDIFYSEPPFSHLADLAVNYENNFDDFLYDIDRAIERAQADDPRGAKIELMTALRTKGREFDTVIVLDANDGIFPNKLSEKQGRLEEERRLFYVTVTRTKNNLLLFDSRRINGKQLTPSRFIDEMELPKSSWLVNPQLDRISSVLLRELKI